VPGFFPLPPFAISYSYFVGVINSATSSMDDLFAAPSANELAARLDLELDLGGDGSGVDGLGDDGLESFAEMLASFTTTVAGQV
jgi:hypothetical protein